jgi:chromosome segregation ATPase
MARGITQDDVWKACDALLLEGGRPTIERVRQKIGSGSPNTVSPFLDSWFKHLGARIKDPGAFAAPPDLPDPIHQAAKHFWESALAQTRGDFDDRLREGLAAAVANVEAEKERVAIANAAAFEAAGKATRLLGDLARRESELEQEKLARATAEAQLVDVLRHIDDLRARLDRALAETAEVRKTSQLAIAQAIERFTTAERRAAREIDAERTARSKAERKADAFDRRLETLQAGAHRGQTQHAEALASLQASLTHQTDRAEKAELDKAELQHRVDGLAESLLDARRESDVARAESALAERAIAALKPAAGAKRRRSALVATDEH